MWFKARAEEVGFAQAVKERDQGDFIAPEVARRTLRRAKLWARSERWKKGPAVGVNGDPPMGLSDSYGFWLNKIGVKYPKPSASSQCSSKYEKIVSHSIPIMLTTKIPRTWGSRSVSRPWGVTATWDKPRYGKPWKKHWEKPWKKQWFLKDMICKW